MPFANAFPRLILNALKFGVIHVMHAALICVYRVPDSEDLFLNRLANLNLGDSQNPLSLYLCNDDKGISGLRALTFIIDYGSEEHLRIGVPRDPNAVAELRRRRKRQVHDVLLTDDWRLYPTSYRYDLHL